MSTVPDFAALHRHLADFSRRGRAAKGTEADGYDRAAYEVGAVVAALGGIQAMHAAFDHVEIHVGLDEAVWLSRRWAGTTDPAGNTWG